MPPVLNKQTQPYDMSIGQDGTLYFRGPFVRRASLEEIHRVLVDPDPSLRRVAFDFGDYPGAYSLSGNGRGYQLEILKVLRQHPWIREYLGQQFRLEPGDRGNRWILCLAPHSCDRIERGRPVVSVSAPSEVEVRVSRS
jgi:hypothetical protein